MGNLKIGDVGGHIDQERELSAAFYTEEHVISDLKGQHLFGCKQDRFYEFLLCKDPQKAIKSPVLNQLFENLKLGPAQRAKMRLRIRKDSVELTFKAEETSKLPKTGDRSISSDRSELTFELTDTNVTKLTSGLCETLEDFLEITDKKVFGMTSRTRFDCLALLKGHLKDIALGIKAIHLDPFNSVVEGGTSRLFKIDIEAIDRKHLELIYRQREAIFAKIEEVLSCPGGSRLRIIEKGVPKMSKERYAKAQYKAAGQNDETQWKQKPSEVWAKRAEVFAEEKPVDFRKDRSSKWRKKGRRKGAA